MKLIKKIYEIVNHANSKDAQKLSWVRFEPFRVNGIYTKANVIEFMFSQHLILQPLIRTEQTTFAISFKIPIHVKLSIYSIQWPFQE